MQTMLERPLIERLHDSEINGSIAWFFDGGWKVELGDPLNGVLAEDVVGSYAEAEAWLDRSARKHFPNSDYARALPLRN